MIRDEMVNQQCTYTSASFSEEVFFKNKDYIESQEFSFRNRDSAFNRQCCSQAVGVQTIVRQAVVFSIQLGMDLVAQGSRIIL